MKHEEFLKQVKERADRLTYMYGDDALKLLAIIEKLREQRNVYHSIADKNDAASLSIAHLDKELDEIVGQG